MGLSETGQLCNDQGGTRGRCEKNRACGWFYYLVKGRFFIEDSGDFCRRRPQTLLAKNAQFPLYVLTNYVNIRVLGTAFNVKTDEKHQNVETVLARGKVALLDKQWNPILDMSPGEKVTYDNNKNEYATEVVDVNVCTAWRLNQFVFENVTLREIVNQLSVKFNVNINLESTKLAQRKFRCVINEDESLPDILKLLKYLAPIQYRIEGKEIFIYE